MTVVNVHGEMLRHLGFVDLTFLGLVRCDGPPTRWADLSIGDRLAG